MTQVTGDTEHADVPLLSVSLGRAGALESCLPLRGALREETGRAAGAAAPCVPLPWDLQVLGGTGRAVRPCHSSQTGKGTLKSSSFFHRSVTVLAEVSGGGLVLSVP